MKMSRRARRQRNLRNLTIGWVERLEGRQLLATIVEYALPSDTPRPTGITSGPDGNLWFAEQNTNNIGRITTAGVVTEFALPANSSPDYITSGPRRQPLVHRPGEQHDRPDHSRRHDHRVPHSHQQQRPIRDHRRTRRRALVRRAGRQPDRSDHHLGYDHRIRRARGSAAPTNSSRVPTATSGSLKSTVTRSARLSPPA